VGADKRVTLTIHEYCSISGVGIWFECVLMQQKLHGIRGDDPAQPHVQWALTECGEECRHSMNAPGPPRRSARRPVHPRV